MSLLSSLPWGQIVKLAISLIGRAIKHSDDLRGLEEDWVRFTKSLNKSIPVNFSQSQIIAIKKLEEKDRLTEAKIKALEIKAGNYQEQAKKLYSENLELKDKSLRSEALAREM